MVNPRSPSLPLKKKPRTVSKIMVECWKIGDQVYLPTIEVDDEPCAASMSFTNTSNLLPMSLLSLNDIVPESAIHYALIAADERGGVFADQCSFDHPQYNIVNEIDSHEYLGNVYSIVLGSWRDVCPLIRDEVEDIYNRRLRLNWSGKDSFYDVWLQIIYAAVFQGGKWPKCTHIGGDFCWSRQIRRLTVILRMTLSVILTAKVKVKK